MKVPLTVIGRSYLIALALLLPASVLAQQTTANVVAELNQQLDALQADPSTAHTAALEKLLAHQAIDALEKARSRDAEQAQYMAQNRVDIARSRARTEAMRQQMRQLEKRRSELRIEGFRRENARIHQEAAVLRMQIQALEEDNQRLRELIEAETIARQDAQTALGRAVGRQAARANAVQQEAARLAREEAELLANARLPASAFGARGEVFTLPSDFWSGQQATLSTQGRNQLRALAEYLNIGKRGRITIEAYGNAAENRAQMLKDVLVNGGVSASRIQAKAGRGAATDQRSAEVVIAP